MAPPIIDVPTTFNRYREDEVNLLVVHAMGEWVIDDDGTRYYCTDFLQRLKLSVHTFCLPDGRIVKSVDTRRIAHHAKGFNGRSAGMEFVVAGAHDLASLYARMADTSNPPYTKAQYESGGWWFAKRAKEHGVHWRNIKRHSELSPDRKRDPGKAFDWEAFHTAYKAHR